MSGHAWFVTSATDPNTPLDGPFLSRDDCEARCLLRTDRLTTLRAFVAGRLPGYYVPRLFGVQVETRHLHRAEARAGGRFVARERHASGGGPLLPEVVHTYTRGGLLALCKALELRMPSSGADKAGIIEHIEKELRALEKGTHG